MPYRSLADFLEALDQDGELARIAVEIDPGLEAAEITRRVALQAGPALLLGNLKGFRTAAVTNLLGTDRRVLQALGASRLSDVADRLTDAGPGSQSWLQRLIGAGQAATADRYQAKVVKNGPCQQVVRLAADVDLRQIPMLRSHAGESGPSLTAPIYTRSLGSDQQWITPGVVQVVETNRLMIRSRRLGRLARDLEEHRSQEQQMPVALVLGGDPALALLLASPLAAEIDSFLLAGILRNQGLELVKCRTNELKVPADADLVIEGFIDLAEPPTEIGPLAIDSGYYSLPAPARTVHVTAMTERVNPVVPLFDFGSPGGEPAMRRAMERILLPLVRQVIPEIVDYALPGLGGSRATLFLAIRKAYPQHARKVSAAVWGWEPLMTSKLVVMVDEGVDLRDPAEVWRQVGANVHPGRDVFFHQGPSDDHDHAAPKEGLGQPMAIDATTKLPEEHPRPWPQRVVPDAAVQELVGRRWSEYGIR